MTPEQRFLTLYGAGTGKWIHRWNRKRRQTMPDLRHYRDAAETAALHLDAVRSARASGRELPLEDTEKHIEELFVQALDDYAAARQRVMESA